MGSVPFVTGPRGIALIKRYESLRLEAYLDTGDVPTIGWGHTGPEVKLGDKITEHQADTLLAVDVRWAERVVNSGVPARYLTQSLFDALVSFVFNLGSKQFRDSSVYRLLNAGDVLTAVGRMYLYHYDNKVKKLGLARRRVAEMALALEDK